MCSGHFVWHARYMMALATGAATQPRGISTMQLLCDRAAEYAMDAHDIHHPLWAALILIVHV